MRYLYLIVVFLFEPFNVYSGKFSSLYKINSIELEYKTSSKRYWDIKSGLYKPEIITPSDLEVYYKDCKHSRLFLALPRADNVIPATLVEVKNKDGLQTFEPYPKWKWHRVSGVNPCKRTRMLSVHKIAIDRCDRLWVLDEGIFKGVDGSVKCPRQLLAFDLKSDKLVHRYTLPEVDFHETSHSLSLIVDTQDDDTCEKTHVYISDGACYTIIVYSLQFETSWVFKHSTLVPNTTESTLKSNFNQIGMGINRDIGQFFYTPFAGVNMFAIRLSILSSEIKLIKKEVNNLLQIIEFPSPRSGKIGTFVVDNDGISFSNLLNTSSLVCWNTRNAIYGDNIHLIEEFPGIINIKIMHNKCSTCLYVLSSNKQGKFKRNFQISYAKTEDLIEGTNCSTFQPITTITRPNRVT